MQNKNKHSRSIRDSNISCNTSYISTPHSVEIMNDLRDYQQKILQQRTSLYKPIAPFQVNIAFQSGIDIKSFLKRAK